MGAGVARRGARSRRWRRRDAPNILLALMKDCGDFSKGDCVVYKGQPVTVVDVTFSTPTARGAGVIVKVKLRNLRTKQLLTDSLRAGDKFDELDVEQHPCTYLYADGTFWHFMDAVSFEQFQFDAETLGDAVGYLKDGQEGLRARLIEGVPLSVTLPTTVDLLVTECDPAIKGATATAQMKWAVLETGLRIQVPPYIVQGEAARVDTRDARFVERVK
jgi:elongation factor P